MKRELIARRVVMAYGDASHPIPDAYVEYANLARETFLFGRFNDASLPSIPTSPSLPAIVIYKSFDERHAIFPASDMASLNHETLAEFVKLNSVRLMDEISPEKLWDVCRTRPAPRVPLRRP